MNAIMLTALTAAAPTLLTIAVTLLLRLKSAAKIPNSVRQTAIGVLFAAAGIILMQLQRYTPELAEYLSDVIPVCAAFVFGAPAGIIAAALKGAAFLLTSVFAGWSRTATADFITMLSAGAAACLIQRFFRRGKRPSVSGAMLFGIVGEGTHLLLLFLTNLDSVTDAYYIADRHIYMAAVSPLAIAAALCVHALLNKHNPFALRKREERSISSSIVRNLVIGIIIAYILTGAMTFAIQTNDVIMQTSEDLNSQLDTLDTEFDTMFQIEMTKTMNAIAYYPDIRMLEPLYTLSSGDITALYERKNISDKSTAEVLRFYADLYDVSQINVLDKNKTVLYSSKPDDIGKVIQDENIYQAINKNNSYVEARVSENGYACSSIRFFNESDVLKDAKYLQILYTQDFLSQKIKSYVSDSSEPFNIGETGFIAILPMEADEHGQRRPINSLLAESAISIPDGIKTFAPENYAENTLSSARWDDTRYYFYYRERAGYYCLSVMKYKSVMLQRNLSVMIVLLMELEIFTIAFLMIYSGIHIHITRNLRRVNGKLDEIRAGKLDTWLDVRPNREFVQLSDSINATVDTLEHYIAAEAARIDGELALAHTIQTNALPNVFPPYPNRREFEIYASMTPARKVGGDFYDFFFTDDDKLAFVIADVSGKGIPAALFMMTARATLKNLALQGNSLQDVFDTANKRLYESNPSLQFVTVWMGILDLRLGMLSYVNAGHTAPVLIRNGETALLAERSGFVLAGKRGSRYRSKELQLQPNDMLLMYTDGVTEAFNNAGELYGEKRLRALCGGAAGVDAQTLCETVKASVDAFSDGCTQADDITMLAIRYKGSVRKFEKLFAAEAARTRDAMDFTSDALNSCGCPPKAVNRMLVAVDEIFSNIAKYAYGRKQGTVRIGICAAPGEITLTFADSGVPFDPTAFVNPEIDALPAAERHIGGLGIFMTKKLMSRVEYAYADGENRLTLTLNY